MKIAVVGGETSTLREQLMVRLSEGKEIRRVGIPSGENSAIEAERMYSSADIFLLVFSLDNPSSFSAIRDIIWPKISNSYRDVPVIVVGLDSGKFVSSAVTSKQINEFCKVCLAPYLKCNPEDQQQVDKVLETALLKAITFLDPAPIQRLDR